MKKLLTLTILVIIIFAFNFNLFGYIWANRSCEAYPLGCDPDPDGDGKSSEQSMGKLIIEGARYFIDSSIEYQKFLEKVELSDLEGTNFDAVKSIINSAILNLETAIAKYEALISIAKETPYRPEVIEALLNFDYSAFQTEKGLIPHIFQPVKSLLSAGNVTEVYIYLKSDMDSILVQLYRIKSSVDSNKFPYISDTWAINQSFFESMFHGQYLAQVFYKIEK